MESAVEKRSWEDSVDFFQEPMFCDDPVAPSKNGLRGVTQDQSDVECDVMDTISVEIFLEHRCPSSVPQPLQTLRLQRRPASEAKSDKSGRAASRSASLDIRKQEADPWQPFADGSKQDSDPWLAASRSASVDSRKQEGDPSVHGGSSSSTSNPSKPRKIKHEPKEPTSSVRSHDAFKAGEDGTSTTEEMPQHHPKKTHGLDTKPPKAKRRPQKLQGSDAEGVNADESAGSVDKDKSAKKPLSASFIRDCAGVKIKMLAASAVVSMMKQQLHSAELQCVACDVMCKMAANGRESCAEIVSSGGIETTVAAMQRYPDDGKLQAAACRVLADVSQCSGSIQARVFTCGGFDAMAAAMQRHLNQTAQQEAVDIVQAATSGKKAPLAKMLMATMHEAKQREQFAGAPYQ